MNGKRLAAMVGIACSICVLAAVAPAHAENEKVVIIGFDGADAELVERWMDEGHLPHLDRLRKEGTFSPLQPTNPPQTPVSWSSFATGMRPGKTEIFDFLKRDPNNYLPDFAMMSETRKPFLFGEKNGWMLGLGGAVVGAVVALGILFWMPWGWPLRGGLAALIAVGCGLGAGYAANAYLPVEQPDAINNRQGRTMWELATEAGLTARVIRVPATFPAEPLKQGSMLSGLGVPDMRGRVGTPAYYTSDPGFEAGGNEFSLELIRLAARRGAIETRIVGPKNKPFYDYVVDREVAKAERSERSAVRRKVRAELDDKGVANRIDLPMTLEASDSSLKIKLQGEEITLSVGQWSDRLTLNFPVNPLVDATAPLQGTAQFKLLSLEPEIELYLSPINFHPDCHPVAFSYPPDYSEELLDRFGMYKTIGWALDTWSLPSGVGDEELFLEDMDATVTQYEKIMEGLLGDGDADLYVQIFYFPDRIGHLFWRFLDTGHPLYDPVQATKYEGKMLEAYQRMDRIVGRARELAGDEVLFLVCSDHGFSSFRRGVNYNNWLVEQGLMVMKEQPSGPATLEKLFDTRDLFAGVDWSQTKAYALGLGSVYVNLIGREKYGIVMPGPEYEEVVAQIKEGLEALVDPETGERPVTRVLHRDEMYGTEDGDYDPDLIPDLRISSNQNYRVSWQTSLGGFGQELIEDNLKPWSGDHCSNDPDLVRGIFFSSKPINTDAPRMIDLMPTVLDYLDIEIPAAVDGKPLL